MSEQTAMSQTSDLAETKGLEPQANPIAQRDQSGVTMATSGTSSSLLAAPTNTVVDKSETQESMAEPELLALIVELRLRAGRAPTKDKNGSVNSSNSKASSAVDTLDLCHRKIEKLPYEMVNIIKEDVIR